MTAPVLLVDGVVTSAPLKRPVSIARLYSRTYGPCALARLGDPRSLRRFEAGREVLP